MPDALNHLSVKKFLTPGMEVVGDARKQFEGIDDSKIHPVTKILNAAFPNVDFLSLIQRLADFTLEDIAHPDFAKNMKLTSEQHLALLVHKIHGRIGLKWKHLLSKDDIPKVEELLSSIDQSLASSS